MHFLAYFSRPKRYAWILDKIHLCRNALLGPLSRVLLLLSSSDRSSEIYSARIHRYQIPTPIKTCARQSTFGGNTSHFGNDFGALKVYLSLMIKVLSFVGNEFWTFTFISIGRFWELLFRPQAEMTRQICALITTPSDRDMGNTNAGC